MYGGKYINQSDVITQINTMTKHWEAYCRQNDGYWDERKACEMMDKITGLMHHLQWSQTFDPNQAESLPNWDKKLFIVKG